MKIGLVLIEKSQIRNEHSEPTNSRDHNSSWWKL